MALKLGVPPKAKGGDFTPPKKGIYNCIVSDFEEVPNIFHEKNLAEGKNSDPTQLLWKLKVMDGDDAGFEYWYYTGISVGRSPKNKFTKLLRLVYPNFSLADGEEVVPTDETDLRSKVLYQPVRVVADVTPPKEKKFEDGETKMVTYGKVVDIWEAEGISRDDVDAAIAALGATKVSESFEDDIPF